MNSASPPAPSALPSSGASRERPTKSLLRERFEAVKPAAIDDAMGKGESWAKKVGYGDQGVQLDDIPRLIAALGLKLVDAAKICITPERAAEYEAYRTIAAAHLANSSGPKLEQDWDPPR
jgi:hypothetical protein